jgi:hypothetical protein
MRSQTTPVINQQLLVKALQTNFDRNSYKLLGVKIIIPMKIYKNIHPGEY